MLCFAGNTYIPQNAAILVSYHLVVEMTSMFDPWNISFKMLEHYALIVLIYYMESMFLHFAVPGQDFLMTTRIPLFGFNYHSLTIYMYFFLNKHNYVQGS